VFTTYNAGVVNSEVLVLAAGKIIVAGEEKLTVSVSGSLLLVVVVGGGVRLWLDVDGLWVDFTNYFRP
jgi:hypothetical protein